MIRQITFYEKYIKRILDIVLALIVIVLFGWLYIVLAILVRLMLGHPVLFKQARVGRIDKNTGIEVQFEMYKFRTMKTENQYRKLDSDRQTKFGNWLRCSSLDEIPQVFNILKGQMSIVGPRPKQASELAYRSDSQRIRQAVRPGLTGLAQINGRNNIGWNEIIEFDLKYIEKITFWGDLKIVVITVFKAFFTREGVK